MGLDDEIIINGEVYVRKSAPLSSVTTAAIAVGTIQQKLARTKYDGNIEMLSNGDSPDGSAMSVQMIKQKLRVANIDRVSNGVEIGQEPFIPDPSPSPPPTAPTQGPSSYQQYQASSNNNFMRRNVKTKDWSNFAIKDAEDDGMISENGDAGEQEPTVTNASVATRPGSHPLQSQSKVSSITLAAKQSDAVDTLKKKLEMKKAASKQEVLVDNSTGNFVSLRHTDVDRFQSGYGRNEVFSMRNQGTGPTSRSSVDPDDLTQPQDFNNSMMVNVKSSNSTSNAKITFSSFDKSKEDYMRQFSEKTRPVSESSPIKAELESIIGTKIIESGGQVDSKPVVINQPDDEAEAQKAAVKAIELAFMKKKERTVEPAPEAHNDVPVPAARQSVARQQSFTLSTTEYKQVAKTQSMSGAPNISFSDFSSSGTNYSNLTKSGPI